MPQPQINYFSRDFEGLKQDLIDYVKEFHPDQFAYFNEANPDMMYLEMLSYIGDIQSFHLDKAFNESFRTTALARQSLVRMANDLRFYNFGPKASSSQVKLSIKVPPVSDGGQLKPNPDVLFGIEDISFSAENGATFETNQEIDFASDVNRDIIPNYDSNNQLIDYTINKYVPVTAGTTQIQRFYVSPEKAKPFLNVSIDDENVVDIKGVVSIKGDVTTSPPDETFNDRDFKYYEVMYLVQDKKFIPVDPEDIADPIEKKEEIESAIKQGEWVNIPKRYIVRRDVNNLVTLVFGNSVPNYEPFKKSIQSQIDASTFSLNKVLNNSTLGEVPPPNSTLFIKYRKGGGIDTNADVGQINSVDDVNYKSTNNNVSLSLLSEVRNSLTVTNEIPATGGRDAMGNEELRSAMEGSISSGDRVVTYPDIRTEIDKMPPEFGQPYRISTEEIKPKVANLSNLEAQLNNILPNIVNSNSKADRQSKKQEIDKLLDSLKNDTVYNPPNSQNTVDLSATSADLLSATPSLWIGEKVRLYIVGIDQNGKLTTITKDQSGNWMSPNQKLKENIRQYLLERRIIGDWFDIVDAEVVNFQVEFTIVADPKNKQATLNKCLQEMKTYFDIENWTLDQPIYIGNTEAVLQQIDGVINVVDMKFYNVFDEDTGSNKDYSPQEIGRYPKIDTNNPLNSLNTKFEMIPENNVILSYPSKIFELRYPDIDIIGKAK